MAASGAKYGIATSHFYWVGAIPAMVFVGIFMMPFYYGSKARSVPEYLKLRFDEKTRGFNAISFAVDDRLLLGHLDVRAGRSCSSCCSAGTSTSRVLGLGGDRAGLHLPRRPHLGDLQRGAAVLPDRARLRCRSCSSGCKRRRRLERAGREAARRWRPRSGFAAGAWTPVLARTWRARRPTRWASSGSAW